MTNDELREKLLTAVRATLPLDNEQDQGAVVNAVLAVVSKEPMVAALMKVIELVTAERDAARAKLNAEREMVDSFEDDALFHREINQQLGQERDEAREESRQLRQELANTQGENRRLRTRVEDLDFAQARNFMEYNLEKGKREELAAEQAANLDLQARVDELTQEMSLEEATDYMNDLDVARAKVKALRARVAELQGLLQVASENPRLCTCGWNINMPDDAHDADCLLLQIRAVIVGCPYCGGAGHDHNADGTPAARECPACGGSGSEKSMR